MNQKSIIQTPLYQSSLHDSAYQHVSGTAIYVDDMPAPARMLHAQVFTSTHALARIEKLDINRALQIDGVHDVLVAADIIGINDIAPFTHDEPLLAEDHVYTTGQGIALVVAETPQLCRDAIKAIEIEYHNLQEQAVMTVREAVAQESYHGTPHIMQRGDLEKGLSEAPLYFEGEIDTGAQDHFYLETQCALVLPLEQNSFHVYSSTQHPSEVQAKVAEVLDIGCHQVVVETKRMGGGFGGKETQGAHYAALAALAASRTQRPVKIWLNRDQDMSMTGKRHPFYSRYRAGFDKDGNILALDVFTVSNAGWACDLSGAILDRCLFHLDNPYYIPCI